MAAYASLPTNCPFGKQIGILVANRFGGIGLAYLDAHAAGLIHHGLFGDHLLDHLGDVVGDHIGGHFFGSANRLNGVLYFAYGDRVGADFGDNIVVRSGSGAAIARDQIPDHRERDERQNRSKKNADRLVSAAEQIKHFFEDLLG